MDSTTEGRPFANGHPGRMIVAHVLLATALCVAAALGKSPRPLSAAMLLQTVLVAQSSLIAIWFALGRSKAWLRILGSVVSLGGLLLLSTAANSGSFPLSQEVGLAIEMLAVPAIGVGVVMLILRWKVLDIETAESNVTDVKPRISLFGLVTIVTVVAVLLGLPPAVQYLAGYDRLSVHIVMQTMALSAISYAAVWTALGGGSTWPRMIVYIAIVIGVALFTGQFSGAIFQFSFGLRQTVTDLLAATIVVVSLMYVRRTGVRCQPRNGSTRQVLLNVSVAAIVACATIGLLDFLYGRSIAPSKPFAAHAPIVDSSGENRHAAMKEFVSSPSAANLTRLLRLNDDGSTVVDELRGLTGGTGTYETIQSVGHKYVVAIGLKAAGRPPGLREQMAHGNSSDWMVQYTTACFFDADGRLLEKLGGQLASDKINGEDVWLTTLGTPDRWFAWIRKFEPHGPYTYETRICLVEPGFPTSFVVLHFPNSTVFTDTPEMARNGSFFIFDGLPGGGRLPNGATGRGRDGKTYAPKISWDNQRGVFTGPARVTYNGQACFEIDLEQSARFRATDDDAQEASE